MKIDTRNIKNMTNEMIGYDLFRKEEFMRKKKLKFRLVVAFIFTFISLGTLTVNAMTDNSIGKGIKNVLTVTINGKTKNASCEKTDDGFINCKLDEDVLGNGTESTISYRTDVDGNFDVKYTEDELDTTIK